MVDQDRLQWLDLVQVAAVIGVGGVVEDAGGVTQHAVAYGGTGVDDVQTQQRADLPFEPDGLGEVETGVDEIDRDLLADAADYMQQRYAVGLEGRTHKHPFACGQIAVEGLLYLCRFILKVGPVHIQSLGGHCRTGVGLNHFTFHQQVQHLIYALLNGFAAGIH